MRKVYHHSEAFCVICRNYVEFESLGLPLNETTLECGHPLDDGNEIRDCFIYRSGEND